MTGVELAMASEKARKRVINSILTQSVQVGNDFVKVVNPDEAKDAVAIIEAAARAAHNLVEAMEQRASRWWKSKTGVDAKSTCFSTNYRHTRGGMQGLPAAHIDAIHVAEWFKPGGVFSPGAQAHLESKLDMKLKDALKHVVVTFNEWINAGGDAIAEWPLTIMDTTTLDKKDVELAWVQGSLDSKMVRWSEAHAWYYRNLGPGEGYMFITSPHEGPKQNFSGTPHSAFNFIRGPGPAPRPRESFEFRCLVIDKSWTSPATIFNLRVPETPTEQQIVQSGASKVMAAMITDSETLLQRMQDNDELVGDPAASSWSFDFSGIFIWAKGQFKRWIPQSLRSS